jgi:MFS family permease
MKDDTHLHGQQYSWLGSIVYFGYMIAQFPLGWILVKVPLAKLMSFLVLTWGVLVCSIMACNSFAGLAAIRFLLGFFEAGIVPINMILTGTWYRREEQPLRTAIWYNTLAGVLGGIFAFAISKLDSKYPVWKLIFLIYGSVSLGLGVAIFFLLPDHPSLAWFYNVEDKKNKVIRIAPNQTGQGNVHQFKWGQIVESLIDPKFWVLALYVIAWGIVNAGITNVSSVRPQLRDTIN